MKEKLYILFGTGPDAVGLVQQIMHGAKIMHGARSCLFPPKPARTPSLVSHLQPSLAWANRYADMAGMLAPVPGDAY